LDPRSFPAKNPNPGSLWKGRQAGSAGNAGDYLRLFLSVLGKVLMVTLQILRMVLAVSWSMFRFMISMIMRMN
jgi:hypothetical protein